MADVNANIGVNIDTSAALAQLKSLQRQISQFNSSIAKSSEQSALAQKSLNTNLINSINSIGAFSAELRTIRTTSEQFTASLESNKFSMREYFRYAGAATKTFGKLFRSEFDTISNVAEERVKKLQTQYIKLGRDSTGAMKAIAIMPKELNMGDYNTQIQIAAQRQALFNQLMKQGSTNLINFGKNTQWAGRQLMVGFTIPLSILGSTATRVFMDMETQAIKFKKVYGDLFTSREETQQALTDIQALGSMYTKYGIAVSQTVGLAADAAAAGFQGIDLQRQTAQATRLSVLGQIDSQQALQTTISLQNAFGLSSDKLAESIDFLNAVENQTVTSLDDITTAIPKVAPVIKSLGGNVKDLAFFLTAMKEGGVNASEGANALKSGLAALINPTARASSMLAGMGINITKIIETNKGNLRNTVVEFAKALDTLDPLTRARAIEQLFGKFQFARLSTLFDNVTRQGTQASRVLDLASTSVEGLAALSEQELGITAASSMNKFKKAIEDVKVALVPVGQTFLDAITPIINFVGGILEKFNDLSSGTKKVITILTIGLGAVGPVLLMTFGLLANGIGNLIKLFLTLRNGYLRLTGQSQILGEQTQYLTTEQLQAEAVAHSLDQSHAKLIQTFTVETGQLNQLAAAYQRALGAMQRFGMSNPGSMLPPRKMATGGVVVGPGTGTSDSVPAMLSNGETVIPAKQSKKYGGFINSIIADNIPGYMSGKLSVGSQVNTLDFARSSTANSAQRLIDEMLKEGSGIENSLTIVNETLARMANDTKISIETFVRELSVVTKEFTGALIPTDVLIAAGRGKSKDEVRKYSSPVKSSISKQVEDYGDIRFIEEVNRAQGSANAAQEAVRKYFIDTGVDLEGTTKVSDNARKIVAQSADVHRAHIIELRDQIDKQFYEAWDPKAWIAQASSLNQLSNILQSSPDTMDEYVRHLNAVNADEQVVASMRQKLTKNIALEENELQVQKQVLQRMLADQQTMSKVSPGFAPQAVGAVAATNYLATWPTNLVEGVGSRSAAEASAQQQALTSRRFRGAQSFTPVTQQAKDLSDAVVLETARAAGTQSPSKRTIPIGEDIARGLEVGMQNRQDDVARVASQLGETAVTQSGLIVPRSAISGSASLNSLSSRTQIPAEKIKQTEAYSKMSVFNERLGKMNNIIMGSTFALTSLAGAGSMAGGAIGNISSQIFKYSGLLFGLMSITQLLTQAKVAELAATRAGTVAKAMGSVSGVKGLFTAGGGIAGFAKNILTAGKFALRFAGWGGLAVTALSVGVTLYNRHNKSIEENRKKVEAFGDSLDNATKAAPKVADYFGYVPNKSALSRTKGLAPTISPERKAIDQLIGSEQFKSKEVQALIESTSKLNNTDAQSALTLAGFKMMGEGASKEQVQTFITAILEEAGKTNLKIDFKSIDFSKDGMAKVESEFTKQIGTLEQAYKNGYKTIFEVKQNNAGVNYLEPVITQSDELKTALENQSKTIATFADGLSLAFNTGTISSQQFKQSFDNFAKSIITNTPNATAAIALLNKSLALTNPELAKNLENYKNVNNQLLIMQAAMMGVNLTEEMLRGLSGKTGAGGGEAARDRRDELDWLTKLKDMMKEATKVQDDFVKNAGKVSSTGGEKSWLQKLADQTEATKTQTEAFYKMRDAGIEASLAAELSSNPEFAKGILAAANGTAESWNKALEAIKAYKVQLDKLRMSEIAGMDKGDYELQRLNKAQAYMDLQSHLIAMQYSAQLDSIDKAQQENDLLLQRISYQETLINNRYNPIIDQLQKIQDLNKSIAEIEARRVDVVTALSSGDISGGVKALMELRSARATQTGQSQIDTLNTARDREISLLKQNNLTKEQLDLQNQKLELDKKEIESTIAKQTANLTYFNMTRSQIDNAAKALDLAKSAGIDINNPGFLNNVLDAAVGKTNALEAAAKSATAAFAALLAAQVAARTTNIPSAVPAVTAPSTITVSDIIAKNVYSKLDRLDAKKGYLSTGGIVPKYFASGGFSRGTDTIPAMLTPGEYVVRKSAVDALGVGALNNINNGRSLSNSVYNYSLSVNVDGTSANANDIARSVMSEIKKIDQQRIRGIR